MPIASSDAARDMARRRHSVDSYVDSIVGRADEIRPDHVSRIVAAAPHARRHAGSGSWPVHLDTGADSRATAAIQSARSRRRA